MLVSVSALLILSEIERQHAGKNQRVILAQRHLSHSQWLFIVNSYDQVCRILRYYVIGLLMCTAWLHFIRCILGDEVMPLSIWGDCTCRMHIPYRC